MPQPKLFLSRYMVLYMVLYNIVVLVEPRIENAISLVTIYIYVRTNRANLHYVNMCMVRPIEFSGGSDSGVSFQVF